MYMPVAPIAFASLALTLVNASAAAPPPDVRRDGMFQFPQQSSKVVYDAKDLRVSAWNDAEHLYVQAVLWTDDDDSLGETEDGRPIGDWSILRLDLDADGKPSSNRDRNYMLNPWPTSPGLHYTTVFREGATSGIMGDTKGLGAIRHHLHEGRRIRLDCYVIPLAEIKRKPGDKIRFAFWASSEKPKLTLNSVGFTSKGRYYSFSLPWDKHHEITLADRPASLALSAVPNGKEDQVPSKKKPVKATPKVGSAPPEVAAKDWLNSDKPPTLSALKGKVVVVEFWATWCGPCVAGIPHLNKLHEEHGRKGLVILSFTDQSKQGIEKFTKQTPIKYILGCGSELSSEYGVGGIPHAFVVGRDGKLAWEGNPGKKEFDAALLKAIDGK